MGRMGHASMDAALIYQHRTADRDCAIADAIDLMLTGYDVCPETLVGVVPGSRVATVMGTGRARLPISDANGRCRQGGDSARFTCAAMLFVCGAGDGNRTRTVSLGTV